MTNSQAAGLVTAAPLWAGSATRKDAGAVAWEPLHHNSQSSFARLAPRGAAIARGGADASTVCPPSTIIHHNRQMTPHSQGRGNPLGACCVVTLAGRQGRVHSVPVGVASFSSTGDACFPLMTRRLLLTQRSRHFFRVRVGSSRRSELR